MKGRTTDIPAPAGEPEMPEIVGYLLTGSRTFVDDVERTESAAFRRRTARNDGTAVEPLVRLSAVRAYGDARAEHARRVALDVGVRTGHPPGMLQDDDRKLSKALASKPDAMRHAREAVAAIAAAPPQGEPK